MPKKKRKKGLVTGYTCFTNKYAWVSMKDGKMAVTDYILYDKHAETWT